MSTKFENFEVPLAGEPSREGTSRVILPGDIPADVAFDSGQAYGHVTTATAKKDIRELSEGQLAFVASIAQSGNLLDAVQHYLSFSIPS